jgi:uncharacterized membrane protein
MSNSIFTLTPLLVLFGEIAFLAILFLLPLQVPRGTGMLTIPVDPEFLDSAEARRIVRRYRIGDIVAALVAAAIAVLAWSLKSNVALILAPIAQLLGVGTLWMMTWRAILPHRLQQPIIRTASLTQAPEPAASWFVEVLASLIPIALAAAFLAAHWSQIPVRFATHYNITGQPDGWGTRTPFQVAWPLLLAAGFILWIALLGWLLARFSTSSSSKPRVLSFTLDILRSVAWLLAIVMSAAALLPAISLRQATLPYFFGGMMLVMFAFFIYLIVRTWRTFRGIPSDQSTPAQRWVGGLFYYNPDDAALLVPKRSGMGYTFNMARPSAWALMAGILLLAFVPLVVTLATRHS